MWTHCLSYFNFSIEPLKSKLTSLILQKCMYCCVLVWVESYWLVFLINYAYVSSFNEIVTFVVGLNSVTLSCKSEPSFALRSLPPYLATRYNFSLSLTLIDYNPWIIEFTHQSVVNAYLPHDHKWRMEIQNT